MLEAVLTRIILRYAQRFSALGVWCLAAVVVVVVVVVAAAAAAIIDEFSSLKGFALHTGELTLYKQPSCDYFGVDYFGALSKLKPCHKTLGESIAVAPHIYRLVHNRVR